MEYALRERDMTRSALRMSLNPCFNGICSARTAAAPAKAAAKAVLILVLMEYALRAWVKQAFVEGYKS